MNLFKEIKPIDKPFSTGLEVMWIDDMEDICIQINGEGKAYEEFSRLRCMLNPGQVKELIATLQEWQKGNLK